MELVTGLLGLEVTATLIVAIVKAMRQGPTSASGVLDVFIMLVVNFFVLLGAMVVASLLQRGALSVFVAVIVQGYILFRLLTNDPEDWLKFRNSKVSRAPTPVPIRDQGTQTWPDGSSYKGEWKDGKFHGHGTYIGHNGSTYTGEWEDARPHGQGTMTYSDGSSYAGEWKEGKFWDGGHL